MSFVKLNITRFDLAPSFCLFLFWHDFITGDVLFSLAFKGEKGSIV